MIPMGTIVTIAMFIGLILSIRHPLIQNSPRFIRNSGGGLVLLAGLWNSLWYGLVHLGEFWGLAALTSGVLMMVIAIDILQPSKFPHNLTRLRPGVQLLLLAFALLYTITIARL